MRIYILSDLHLEFGAFQPPDLDIDLLILAGDIHVGSGGVEWAEQYFEHIPVIYVLGNHEYYGSSMPEHLETLKEITRGSNIHILENESIQINDVQFLCCTLWTDFNLQGNARSAKNMATRYVSDYETINYGASRRKIKSSDIFKLHQKSIAWLSKELKSEPKGKRVIVTHHAPSQKSLPNDFKNSFISAAYASHLDKTVSESNANIWVHGHIHNNIDYMLGNTRVVCNPRGYSDSVNGQFNPNLILDI
jgi:Icc-related predicted phosphoesterase